MNSHTMVVEMIDENIDKKFTLQLRDFLFVWSHNPNKPKVRKHNSNEVTKKNLQNDRSSSRILSNTRNLCTHKHCILVMAQIPHIEIIRKLRNRMAVRVRKDIIFRGYCYNLEIWNGKKYNICHIFYNIFHTTNFFLFEFPSLKSCLAFTVSLYCCLKLIKKIPSNLFLTSCQQSSTNSKYILVKS